MVHSMIKNTLLIEFFTLMKTFFSLQLDEKKVSLQIKLFFTAIIIAIYEKLFCVFFVDCYFILFVVKDEKEADTCRGVRRGGRGALSSPGN